MKITKKEELMKLTKTGLINEIHILNQTISRIKNNDSTKYYYIKNMERHIKYIRDKMNWFMSHPYSTMKSIKTRKK